jgi:hypothetical protein
MNPNSKDLHVISACDNKTFVYNYKLDKSHSIK